MATSTARIEANRRNSLRSTGPRTAAGKAASRLNAFQHGMAGQGDVLRPGEDSALIARRAEAYARELQAVGGMGLVLAQRVAVLSVRLEQLAARESIAEAVAEQRGRAEFTEDREAAIAELLAEAREPGADPTAALAVLLGCPDGVAGLIAAWQELAERFRAGDSGEAAEVAGRWFGGTEPDGAWLGRVDAELARLRVVAQSMAGQEQAIEQARREAGWLARFDPSPEANLARRYEAAAERGMYRAFRAIAERNRDRGNIAVPMAGDLPASPAAPRPPRAVVAPPASVLPPRSTAPSAPLGSFRTEVRDTASSLTTLLGGLLEPGLSPTPRRKKRPDLRKLGLTR